MFSLVFISFVLLLVLEWFNFCSVLCRQAPEHIIYRYLFVFKCHGERVLVLSWPRKSAELWVIWNTRIRICRRTRWASSGCVVRVETGGKRDLWSNQYKLT